MFSSTIIWLRTDSIYDVDHPHLTESQPDDDASSVLTTSTRVTTAREADSAEQIMTTANLVAIAANGTSMTSPTVMVRKPASPPPRQTSEDSGIEPDCFCLPDDETADTFGLVASMTAAAESESFLLCQPNWAPFLTHVRRTIGPLRTELEALLLRQRGHGGHHDSGGEGEDATAEEVVAGLAAKVQRFCQDSLIAFPKTLATAGRSPRYQDSLRVAVENLVMQLLHTNHLWPLISALFRQARAQRQYYRRVQNKKLGKKNYLL